MQDKYSKFKEVFITIYQSMCQESQKLEEQIQSLNVQIQSLPEGNLICHQNGKHFKYFKSDGQPLTYISKQNHPLIESLAIKKYLISHRDELMYEKQAVDTYIQKITQKPNLRESLLMPHSGYQPFLAPYFRQNQEENQIWQSTPYEHNPKNPENLIHKTLSCNMVRSKSEALIDMVLYMRKIPFRYECALHLGNITLYPDFTIRHPDTGKIYYWEHFGLMDDPSYCKNTFAKLQLYASHNIIPTLQLITTYETKEHPLSSDQIEQVVSHYFQ